jgi:hypothetical protein
MTLEELGFDKFLNKSKPPQQFAADDIDYILEAISGDKITEGIATSSNERLAVDFNNGMIQIKEGDSIRAEFGKFVDEKIGVRVYDSSGSTVVDNTA